MLLYYALQTFLLYTFQRGQSYTDNRYFILTDWFSVLVFTKIAKSYIEDYMEVVIKHKNYECKGK